MKIRTYFEMIFLAAVIIISAACGSSDKGGSDDTSGSVVNEDGGNPVSGPVRAIVKLATEGLLPAGTLIGGIDFILNLPPGVTVKASPDSANPALQVANNGVVAASGVVSAANTQALAIYTPAAGPTPGSITVAVVSADGFGIGEFVTIIGDIAEGASTTASGFEVAGLTVVDLNGEIISGFSTSISVVLP